MTTAPQLIYHALSGHATQDASQQHCMLCGGEAHGARLYRPAPSFTDYDILFPATTVICNACAWFLNERNEDLQKWLDRDKPQRPRNYSYFVRDGQLHILSKAQKRDMAALLRDCIPEVACIAISGQRHIVFRCPVNPPGQKVGTIQFEKAILSMGSEEYMRLQDNVNTLYRANYSKQSIESGQYKFYPDSDIELWKDYEARIRPYRGGMLLSLCVYLAWREE